MAPGAVYRFVVEELAPGVHLLSQGDTFHVQPRGNVAVIEQAAGFVLVDSGGSPAGAEEVIAFVKSRSAKPVTAIVLTHWHGDHVLGTSRLKQEWPRARVISTPPTRDMLASPDADQFMPGDDGTANTAYMKTVREGVEFLEAASRDQKLTAADRDGFARAAREYAQFEREMAPARRVRSIDVFEGRQTLPDDTRPIELMFLGRANTAGDAVAWLPRQRVVITGDVVVKPVPFGFNTYPKEWTDVLARINALDFAVLAPGHGTALRDTTYLDWLITALAQVRAEVGPFARTDKTADAVSEAIDFTTARDRIAGADPWLRRWFRSYWQDAVVSSALREARGEPVVQGRS